MCPLVLQMLWLPSSSSTTARAVDSTTSRADAASADAPIAAPSGESSSATVTSEVTGTSLQGSAAIPPGFEPQTSSSSTTSGTTTTASRTAQHYEEAAQVKEYILQAWDTQRPCCALERTRRGGCVCGGGVSRLSTCSMHAASSNSAGGSDGTTIKCSCIKTITIP